MASAAVPSRLPVASISARRNKPTAPRAALYHYPQPPRLSRRCKRSTGGEPPRSRLCVVASSSKADPVEEMTPVAPVPDVAAPAAPSPPAEPQPQVSTGTWKWRGYSIRYQHAGTSGPALVLIHGFGANSDHWRKNIPVLAMANRVYAIDLIGYGYSDKPNPREIEENFYTFETWGEQLNTFCAEVVKSEAFFVCNSIGGLVGLQAAVLEPQKCKGILLLDISLRMFHIKKQPWFGKPFIKSFQSLLRNTIVGKFFFNAVATPESVKNILCQVYGPFAQAQALT